MQRELFDFCGNTTSKRSLRPKHFKGAVYNTHSRNVVSGKSNKTNSPYSFNRLKECLECRSGVKDFYPDALTLAKLDFSEERFLNIYLKNDDPSFLEVISLCRVFGIEAVEFGPLERSEVREMDKYLKKYCTN